MHQQKNTDETNLSNYMSKNKKRKSQMQTKSNYSRRSTESKRPSLFAFFLFCFLLAFVCILCFLFLGFVCFDSDSDLDQFVVVVVAPKNRWRWGGCIFNRLQDSLFRQVYWAVSRLDPLYDSWLSRCPELSKRLLSCFGRSILWKFM